MADLKLDPITHDLAIENDSLVLVEGVDAIAQDVKIRLQFFLGEWFLDLRIGMPYFQKILGQKPRLSVVKSIFRDAILTTPGILNISDLVVGFESRERKLRVTFKASTVEGPFEFDEELII